VQQSADDGKVDHDGTRFALPVLDTQALAVTGLQLGKQRQRIMIIAEAHGLARLQGIQRAKDGGMTEALGDAARIEGVEGFLGGVIADVNGLHWRSSTTLPDWQPPAIVGKGMVSFLDKNRNPGLFRHGSLRFASLFPCKLL